MATVYRHIKMGYYTISPFDLPRAVKFKPRHSKKANYVPKCVKQGRTYQDYLNYMEANPSLPVTHLDTVIGRTGGKVIMTIHFLNGDFMVGLLLENKTAAEAAEKLKLSKDVLKVLALILAILFPYCLLTMAESLAMPPHLKMMKTEIWKLICFIVNLMLLMKNRILKKIIRFFVILFLKALLSTILHKKQLI